MIHEIYDYIYDSVENLTTRTNNGLLQSWTNNSLNQLTSVGASGTITVKGNTSSAATNVAVNRSTATLYLDNTFALSGVSLATTNFTAIAADSLGRKDTNTVSIPTIAAASLGYDQNGNLTNDGRRVFVYDDENQLIRVTVTNSFSTRLDYDGRMRLRVRHESNWISSAWVKTAEVRYIYDGMLVIQTRDAYNLPTVTYTRGTDLSGTLDGAGGIGGLLARTDHGTLPATHAYYHADGNGNVTMLVNQQQAVVAKYWYDPFGNVYAKTGPLAEGNVYQFSSKEFHAASGLSYYGYRFYDAIMQRWVNQDPIGEWGGINTYGFVLNAPTSGFDSLGLESGIAPPMSPPRSIPRIPAPPMRVPLPGLPAAVCLVWVFDKCVEWWPMPNPDPLPLPKRKPTPKCKAPSPPPQAETPGEECRRKCNEDWEAGDEICRKLPVEYRRKCYQDIDDALNKCLRNCNQQYGN